MTVSCSILALILLSLTHLAAAQNVSIQLTPQGMPIQIPATGGSFNYTIAATNNGMTPQRATVWCMITLPNGHPYGPVLGPARITLSPSQTIERQRTQVIPAGFPAGNYSFNGYVGVYPDSIWDSDTFPFEKTLEGSELWVARYNGPGNSSDAASSIAVDDAGNVYVTGFGFGSGTNLDYATIKYDASGIQQWVARYNGPYNSDDYAFAIAVDGDGNIYVTGDSYGVGTNYDYATVKYDASGNELWVARYNGPGNYSDEANAIVIDGGGNVLVTGKSFGGASNWDYATIKYDASGNQLWVARYNGPGNGMDAGYSIAVDGDGNVYVTGESDGTYINFDPDYATIKYDASGNELWVARYNAQLWGHDRAFAIAVDGNGNAYVTGGSVVGVTSFDYATVKYDASGNQLWVARYTGPGNNTDNALSIALDAGGNVYVTGASEGDGTYSDYATIKYDALGNMFWVARYNGPANSTDWPRCVAVDGGGNVYVTGGSLGSGLNSDYATIKYNSAGAEQWVARYNAPGNNNDDANALALDAAGNVHVTGLSVGIGTGDDYCTIKYSGGEEPWLPVEATVLGQPLPQECRLEQNYPNPFNAATVLSYQLPVASHVSLRIYDTAGRLVQTLVDGWRSAGTHELTFDASDLPSGMYIYRIQTGEWTESGKMVLVK
jgi:hypothetical protein